jgi:hypothetical protein
MDPGQHVLSGMASAIHYRSGKLPLLNPLTDAPGSSLGLAAIFLTQRFFRSWSGCDRTGEIG